MSATTAAQEPRFQWDIIVPNTPFWNSLDHEVGRAFIPCFTEQELSSLPLDENLASDEKLHLLRNILNEKLTTKENDAAPKALHDVDYRAWRTLKSSIATIDGSLGDHSNDEAHWREFYENGPEGKKDMSALSGLSYAQLHAGKFAEAEVTVKELLQWLQGHEALGPDSPQALGCMRLLVTCTWKQGRKEEAREWVKRCEQSIENLGRGKFAKYYDEEEEELASVVKGLEAEGGESAANRPLTDSSKL